MYRPRPTRSSQNATLACRMELSWRTSDAADAACRARIAATLTDTGCVTGLLGGTARSIRAPGAPRRAAWRPLCWAELIPTRLRGRSVTPGRIDIIGSGGGLRTPTVPGLNRGLCQLGYAADGGLAWSRTTPPKGAALQAACRNRRLCLPVVAPEGFEHH